MLMAAICAINNIIRHTNSLKKSANLCIYILSNNKNNTHRSDQLLIIFGADSSRAYIPRQFDTDVECRFYYDMCYIRIILIIAE